MYDIMTEAGAVSSKTHLCVTRDGSQNRLFFSDDFYDIVQAKRLCVECPSREPCLEEAVKRQESCGVWGGHLIAEGRIVPRTPVSLEVRNKYGRRNYRNDDIVVQVPEHLRSFVGSRTGKKDTKLAAKRDRMSIEFVPMTLRTIDSGTMLPYEGGFGGYAKIVHKETCNWEHMLKFKKYRNNPDNWCFLRLQIHPDGREVEDLLRLSAKYDVRDVGWLPDVWKNYCE